ncbi:MAG TPA: ECF-type sigma factor, partial [Rhodothermia bacterium]
MTGSSDVAQLLASYRAGDGAAVNDMLPVIYEELHRIAHRILSGERPGHTLSTTALVHEAYFKLVNQRSVDWKDRAHFC